MTVMAIGAAAVISMQRASMQGNLDARKTDVANSIARTWVERLQRDAMQWTQPGPTNRGGNNLATAQLLSAGLANPGAWFLPNQYLANNPPWSPGFDILGRDLPTLGPELFCVGVRMTWLAQPNPAAGIGALIRADVRVLWLRGISSNPTTGKVCDAVTIPTPPLDPTVYHAIYVTTALQGNPQ